MTHYNHKIQIAQPHINQEEIDSVVSVLESGELSSGDYVADFENAWSAKIGNNNHTIATNNGTSAIHASLLALGVGRNDEVIVPAFSFFSTASMITACGALPIFCDVDECGNMSNVELIEKAISPSTKAIIVTNLYGRLNKNIKKIEKLCNEYGIALIVDSCQMPHPEGAKYGDISCFSFYATKNITTGEGGMVTTKYAGVAENIRSIINHGQREKKYVHCDMGFNYRMTNIAAAIGLGQLKQLDEINLKRIEIAKLYNKYIHPPLLMFYHEDIPNVYHQYVIITKLHMRNQLIERLQANNIESAIHYPTPIPMQPIYKKYYPGVQEKIPISVWLSERVLSLPCHPRMDAKDAFRVIQTINSSVN